MIHTRNQKRTIYRPKQYISNLMCQSVVHQLFDMSKTWVDFIHVVIRHR